MFHFTFKNDFLEEYVIHLYLLTLIYEIFKFLENFGSFLLRFTYLGIRITSHIESEYWDEKGIKINCL